MPQFVIDLLPKDGPLVRITPSRVSDRFIKYLKQLNMRTFRFYDLRHYSASIVHGIGVPDVYIMQRGGWSSDATLKNIYRGAMDGYSKKFTDLTNSHFEEMQHEMQHKKNLVNTRVLTCGRWDLNKSPTSKTPIERSFPDTDLRCVNRV